MRKLIIISAVFLLLSSCQKQVFVKNAGNIFGTSYHFTYQTINGINLESEILLELQKFNQSLNTYDKNSVISRINQNDTTVVLDAYFITCWNKAIEISEITNGAFDMTVAPIVNAWGFGFDESIHADSMKIDSLMQYVGYKKVQIINSSIKKEFPETMLDASAIAKGYGVDVTAKFLENQGIENYMVEIGGEVFAKGKNAKGKLWRIGIDKPIDDPAATNRELQAILSLNNKSLATSGNYRQFYEKNGIKYAHTINPLTGYPALSNLLSATVLAKNCITADAFATAFMVLGVEKSIKLAEQLDYLEAFFIYSDSSNNITTYQTKNFIINK